MTTRGMGTAEAAQIADWMVDILRAPADKAIQARVRESVTELCRRFPLYPELGEASLPSHGAELAGPSA